MTKFELPEKPKKTNTSEDFNNLRKAVDELDKFDYAWKTHANKADRRINTANKYIEELERENQRLIAENVAVKTLVDNARPQQALPVVKDFVAEWLDSNNLASLLDEWYCHHDDMSSHIREYFERLPYKGPNNLSEMENNIVTFITRAKLGGYKLEKPQLFYLKNKLTGLWLMRDEVDKVYPYDHTFDIRNRDKFTQQEIDSMQTGSYEQFEVTE